MSPRVAVLIAGWAHRAEALGPLAAGLDRTERPRVTSPDELLDDERGSYEEGLRGLLDRPSTLVGWSMGGMIALEAAARWPELVTALVIIGGTARFCAGDDYEYGVPARTVRAMALGIRSAPGPILEEFHTQVAAPACLAEDSLREQVEAALSLGTARLGHGLRYLERYDCRGRLGGIEAPVLVIHGSEDRIVPWQAGAFLSDALPRGRFRLYEQAGHALPLTEAPAVADEISTFLEERS